MVITIGRDTLLAIVKLGRYGKQSLQYPQNVKIEDSGLRCGQALSFPKIGEVKANLHRLFDGELKTVTISKTKTEKYYASLLFDDGLPEVKPNNNGKVLGIDLGISSYCITSDGSKYDNPRHLRKHELIEILMQLKTVEMKV